MHHLIKQSDRDICKQIALLKADISLGENAMSIAGTMFDLDKKGQTISTIGGEIQSLIIRSN